MPKAISASAIFGGVGYAPHLVQRRIHVAKATSRFRTVCAGRRTGKSTTGGHELTLHAMEAYYRQNELDPHGHRMEYWIIGPEYSDSEKEFRVLYNDLKKLEFDFDHPGTYYDANGGNMHISLFGGRYQVHAKSAKYPTSLTGEALYGAIFAEAAKLKPIIWSKFIRPMLADYRGWALLTSTPEGKNWFYEAWQRGQQDDPEWWSIRMPSWANDILFPLGRQDPEIASMAHGMSEEKFKQEIGAEFTEFVGRVFKQFDEETHVGIHSYDPRWPLYLAADFGFTNPAVILFIQVDIWDNVWVLGEYYQRNKTSEEIAREVADDPRLGPLLRKAKLLYPDPEDPGDAKTLSNKWKVPLGHGTGGPLKDRIDLIRRWLKVPFNLEHLPDDHEEKLPKQNFDFSCVNTIREMQDYRYPENTTELQNDRENPLKKDDHAPEALGRFFGGHFGHTLDKRIARQRTAKSA